MTEVQVDKQRLRDVRVQLHWTQAQLSVASGVSDLTIVRAEQGRPIQALTAQKLLEALNAGRVERGWEQLSLYDLDWNIQ